MDDGFDFSSGLTEIAPNLFVPNAYGGNVPSVSYPEQFFEQNRADLSNFWIGRRNRSIEWRLRQCGTSRILEIGSGHGAVAQYLASQGFSVRCVEPQIAGATQTASQGIQTLVSTTPSDHLKAKSQEAIGIFDVLEHVQSEQTLLRSIHDLLSPNGVLIITVPTGNWLFSNTDIALGHFRRYSRKRLRHVMHESGFDEVSSNYIFLTLVPLAFLFRVMPYRFGFKQRQNQTLESVSEVLNSRSFASRLVGFVSRIEELFDRLCMLPYGLSIIGVYKARDTSAGDQDSA